MESEWRWNVERFGFGGWGVVPGSSPDDIIEVKMIAELKHPFPVLWLVYSGVGLAVRKDGTRLMKWFDLLASWPHDTFDVWHPMPGSFPWGIEVLPDGTGVIP